jgi:signal transduction histidine kinase
MSRWPILWFSEPMSPALESEMRVEWLVMLTRSQPLAAIANSLNSLLVIGFLLRGHPTVPLLFWLAVFEGLAAAQFLHWLRNHKRPRPIMVSPRFIPRAVVWTTVGGGVWGLFSATYFLGGGPGEQLLIGILIAAMAAGGASSLATLPAAAATYVLACILPFTVVALLSHGAVYYILTLLSIVLLFFLLATVRNGYLSFERAVSLRLRNAELLEVAREANRAKANFLAQFSHELRTPLNAIIGFSESMKAQLLGPIDNARYREYLGWINESGVHLLDLINNILNSARFEADDGKIEPQPVDLGALADGVVRMIDGTDDAAGVALRNRIPEDTWVNVDRTKFKQILINLVSNAVKFTDGGGTVAIRLVPDEAGGASLEVSDTGAGIEPADVERVLEPFVRTDAALIQGKQGAGLGLPIAKMLAQLHGGDLTIESRPGAGTTVKVHLPAAVMTASGPPRTERAAV